MSLSVLRGYFSSLFLAWIFCLTNFAVAQTQLELGSPAKANPMIAGVNNNFIRGDFPFDDAAFRAIIKASNATSLRYPGGTSGSLFDWQTNQFVDDDLLYAYGPKSWHRRHGEMKRRIAQSPANTFSADNFAKMCNALNVEPFWIPNPVTVSPQDNVRFFEHLKANNIACNFVEMGNECSGGAFRKRFPRGSDYADAIRPVMKRIKELYPDAKIAVVANGHGAMKMKKEEQESGTSDIRGETWNPLLIADRQYFDAIVLHSYGISPTRLREYPASQWEDLMLAYPGAYMNQIANLSRTQYNATPIWLTEYNAAFHHLMEARPRLHDEAEAFFTQVRDSPMHGLMIASYFLGAMNDPQMWPVMHYHSLAGPAGFRLVKRENEKWSVGAKTQIFSYLSQLLKESKTMYSVTFKDCPKLPFNALDQPLDALAAAAMENDQQRHWLVMNRSSAEQAITLPWDHAQSVTIRTLNGQQANKTSQTQWVNLAQMNTTQFPWIGPIAIPSKTLKPLNNEKFISQNLPPHSLTVLSMTR